MLNLENKKPSELIQILDLVKISTISYSEKKRIIDEIEYKLGIRQREDVLEQIMEGSADIDDINQ